MPVTVGLIMAGAGLLVASTAQGVLTLGITVAAAAAVLATRVHPLALLAAGAVSGECRPDAVYEYLARGYTSAGRSFYRGVEMLEPGCALKVSPTGLLRTWEWWRPERGESDEFIEPTLIGEDTLIGQSDSVVCFNFRPDRMRQLVQALDDTGMQLTLAKASARQGDLAAAAKLKAQVVKARMAQAARK